MTIAYTDVKTLWARAAGLCSMPDCRKKLTPESEGLATGAVIIGENCHIISGANKGPRSEHPISEDEVDRYPNLILLCSIHHKIIDSDVETWTLEKVIETKQQHEYWIESSIHNYIHANDLVYSNLIANAEKLLMLKYWNWLTDHAIRMLGNEEWLDGIYQFRIQVRRALLPKKLPELERLFENLAARAFLYAEHYKSMAYLPDGDDGFYRENKSWKKTIHPYETYEKYAARSDEWAKKSHLLLMNFTHAVNEFADCVRTYINPHFFLSKGKFTICDELGVLNELESCEIFVSKYEDV